MKNSKGAAMPSRGDRRTELIKWTMMLAVYKEGPATRPEALRDNESDQECWKVPEQGGVPMDRPRACNKRWVAPCTWMSLQVFGRLVT